MITGVIANMYNYSGITYRLWGECGIIALLGIVNIIIGFITAKPDLSKRCFIGGMFAVLVAFFCSIEYFSSIRNPEIQVFEGTYSEEYRNSRVAPPLPLTWEYRFFDSDGKSYIFYLDVLSKRQIYDEDFLEDDLYRVFYEPETKIIVQIDHLDG